MSLTFSTSFADRWRGVWLFLRALLFGLVGNTGSLVKTLMLPSFVVEMLSALLTSA